MNESRIYTRAYLGSSSKQLISGKGPHNVPLSPGELLNEFRNHADQFQTTSTALVSVSSRIVDTVKRAYEKYREGASPDNTWVVFIKVSSTTQDPPLKIHSAQHLAESCGLSEPTRFYHEYLFEWEIPEKYVSHRVSLQTLMARGLDRDKDYLRETISTADLRCSIAASLIDSNGWEIGIYLGCFARLFRAQAPCSWIAHQLFYDCLGPKILEEDVVKLQDANGKDYGRVDFTFFCELDDGVETTLGN